MRRVIMEEKIGNTTIRVTKDGDLCSLVRDGKVLATDWKDNILEQYEELALSLYRHYKSLEKNQMTKSKLLGVINELLGAISSWEHDERTDAEILEANVSNVLTHEEQMKLLDEITDINKGERNDK